MLHAERQIKLKDVLFWAVESIIVTSMVSTAWEREDARLRFVAPTERWREARLCSTILILGS